MVVAGYGLTLHTSVLYCRVAPHISSLWSWHSSCNTQIRDCHDDPKRNHGVVVWTGSACLLLSLIVASTCAFVQVEHLPCDLQTSLAFEFWRIFVAWGGVCGGRRAFFRISQSK